VLDAGARGHGDRVPLPRLLLGRGCVESGAPARLVLAEPGTAGPGTDGDTVALWQKDCGRKWKHRGGARGPGRLRGRGSRFRDDAAHRPHLGPPRAHATCESAAAPGTGSPSLPWPAANPARCPGSSTDLSTHRAAGLRTYADEHRLLTVFQVFQLPSYVPGLNRVQGIRPVTAPRSRPASSCSRPVPGVLAG
jgi:hypothetical protein